MKTIREWLEELPEPYRTQALGNSKENILDINHKPTFANQYLSDKIEELKELAKSQGMECEVVCKERKRMIVNFDLSSQNINGKDAEFKFILSDKKHIDLLDAGQFLAKQLEKYLNNEL